MRLSFILMTVVSALSVHQVPVTASVGSGVALTGVMSLGFVHLVGADQSVSDQSRFLRGNNIVEGDKEERGFYEVVQKMIAKSVVDKMVKTESFSKLEKIDDLTRLNQISGAADDHLVSVFKFADNAKMKPDDLVARLRTIDGADEDIIKKSVEMYTSYLKGLGKEV